jgi:hypothetical protein
MKEDDGRTATIACLLGRHALCLKDKRRDEMRRTPVALIVLVSSVIVLSSANPAKAASYPVCLAGGSDNALRCDYANFEECRATASGGLGYCVANPMSVFNAHASYRGSALWRQSFGFSGAVTREDRSAGASPTARYIDGHVGIRAPRAGASATRPAAGGVCDVGDNPFVC